jgi:ABC-type xylose transport system substrate-binding protein
MQQSIPSRSMPLHLVLLQAFSRPVCSYQYWNAFYLNPQRYGQAVHCYASAHHASRRAHQIRRWQAALEQGNLDTLAVSLCALSAADLEAVIARQDAANGAAAITTMSDADLACLMVDMGADARRAHTR